MTTPDTTDTRKASSTPSSQTVSVTRLTEGNIGRQLASMAMPMAIGILATMSLNIIDTFFVSTLGDLPLAALSFSFPVIMLLISLSIGLGAGTSSVVSFAAGKEDSANVKALITDSMTLTAILSIILGVIGIFTIDPLFMLLGAEQEVIPLIKDYMLIWYVSIVFFAIPMVGMSSMRALGDTKFQGHMMIWMAVANAILDPFLIFGWGPFPRLEIAGAAIATLVVRVVSLVVLLYWLRVKMDVLVNPFNVSRFIRSSKEVLHVGIPAMATNMIIPISGSVLIAMVATHGTEAVAGFGVATRIESVALIFFYALSAVVGPFCGQNLGARDFDRLHTCQRIVLKFCFYSGLLLSVILALTGEWLATFFSSDPMVIDVTKTYLYIVPISYFAYGVVMCVNASFNGLRKPMPGVVISSARVIFVLLPFAWVGNHFFQVTGLMIATALSNIVVGVLAYVWIRGTIRGYSRQPAAEI